VDVNWAEAQHLNFLLEIVAAIGETEKDRKPRKATHAELLAAMV
jgi:hypothetical protein